MSRGLGVTLALAVCAAAMVLMAACGSEDDGGPRKILPAEEEPDAFARRMAKLLETARTEEECSEIYQINGRSATPFRCPAPPDLRRSMARFRVVGSDIYGTGGIVDYRSGEAPDGAALVLYAAPNRSWGVGHLGLPTEPSVDTSDAGHRPGYRTAAERYLRAIERRDCEALVKVAATATNNRAENCGRPFDATAALAKRLRRNPGSELRYEGGNGTYGFLSLETRRPAVEKITIGVMRLRQAGGTRYVVLDAAPAPSSEDMHALREDIRVQERLEKLRERERTQTSDGEPVEP